MNTPRGFAARVLFASPVFVLCVKSPCLLCVRFAAHNQRVVCLKAYNAPPVFRPAHGRKTHTSASAPVCFNAIGIICKCAASLFPVAFPCAYKHKRFRACAFRFACRYSRARLLCVHGKITGLFLRPCYAVKRCRRPFILRRASVAVLYIRLSRCADIAITAGLAGLRPLPPCVLARAFVL